MNTKKVSYYDYINHCYEMAKKTNNIKYYSNLATKACRWILKESPNDYSQVYQYKKSIFNGLDGVKYSFVTFTDSKNEGTIKRPKYVYKRSYAIAKWNVKNGKLSLADIFFRPNISFRKKRVSSLEIIEELETAPRRNSKYWKQCINGELL